MALSTERERLKRERASGSVFEQKELVRTLRIEVGVLKKEVKQLKRENEKLKKKLEKKEQEKGFRPVVSRKRKAEVKTEALKQEVD